MEIPSWFYIFSAVISAISFVSIIIFLNSAGRLMDKKKDQD